MQFHAPASKRGLGTTPSSGPPSESNSSCPSARNSNAGGCPALQYSSLPVAGSSLARNKLASGATDDIRQRSRFTPVTISCGSAVCRCVHANQPHEMRGPHPGCQTLAADVTKREDYAAARLSSTVKKSPGKCRTAKISLAISKSPCRTRRGAHRRRCTCGSFEERGVQIGVILLKRRELQFQFLLACRIT